MIISLCFLRTKSHSSPFIYFFLAYYIIFNEINKFLMWSSFNILKLLSSNILLLNPKFKEHKIYKSDFLLYKKEEEIQIKGRNSNKRKKKETLLFESINFQRPITKKSITTMEYN